MAMKVNELMVGDWVNMGNPVTDELVPTKIENIYGEEINCKTDHTSDDVPTIIYGEWLRYAQPIPLTDDILEKNGFVKTWNGDWQLKEYATIIISKDYYVKVFERSIRIDYVHELQHALHAACIEKEIEL